jgi:hypothetical protein
LFSTPAEAAAYHDYVQRDIEKLNTVLTYSLLEFPSSFSDLSTTYERA